MLAYANDDCLATRSALFVKGDNASIPNSPLVLEYYRSLRVAEKGVVWGLGTLDENETHAVSGGRRFCVQTTTM